MKNTLLIGIAWLSCLMASAQFTTASQWTWVKGDSAIPQFGVYGTRGIPDPANKPGGRQQAVSWKDATGNLWLFGGQANDSRYSGSINDLWKYTPASNLWTWMKGDSLVGGVTVYGSKGVASPNNTPGARTQSMSWTDATGNLWLFGGYGNATNGVTDLNDLWKYDPISNQWTWVLGDSIAGVPPIYGTPGVAAPANKPGGRLQAVTWTDAAGKLWMFGGYGLSNSGYGRLPDLWMYDPSTNQWTWMKGYSNANTSGVYGTQGVTDPNNLPGARNACVSWLDGNGKFWIFGGVNNLGNSVFNDLWMYDPSTNNWTWMKGDNALNVYGVYGVKGTNAISNKPGGRQVAVTWTDALGKLWMHGGSGYAATTSGQMNDLWKYDPSTNQWTWVNGDSTVNVNGVYGSQGVYSPNAKPGARSSAISWTDQSGKFWLSGGSGYAAISNGLMNDLWQFNPATNQWRWVKGDTAIVPPPVYGTQGVPSPLNKPGSRNLATSFTDNTGTLWMFGGFGVDAQGNGGPLNDLWRYNTSTNQWTFMKGDTISNQYGTYGNKGVAAPLNKPGSRAYSVSWSDNSGNIWLFGGFGAALNAFGNLNDLWKYNTTTNQWTWISGDSIPELPGIYGNLGTPSPTNKPGGRQSASSFTDLAGNFWLFGGRGKAQSGAGFGGYLSDLWKYDPLANQWTWFKGDSVVNKAGIYGTFATAAPANKPGGRQNPVSWTDNSGNLVLFGGNGYAASQAGFGGFLSDLWKYDITSNQWTWIKGDSVINLQGQYGTTGTANNSNKPGSRYGSIAWKDNSGKLLLFGGYGFAATDYGTFGGSLNDLWSYSPSTNQWTWLKGDSTINVIGNYGTQGTASPFTKPGARTSSISWKDNAGNLLLFGGNGYASVGFGNLNDLWRLNASAPLPITLLSFTGELQNKNALLHWKISNEYNSKGFEVQKSLDGLTFTRIGFVNSDNLQGINDYNFTDTRVVDGFNYYRLQQFDLDGRFVYSPIIKLQYTQFKWYISGNPYTANSAAILNLDNQSEVSLQIVTSDGAIIQKISPGLLSVGTHRIPLDLNRVSKGVYFVMLQVNDQQFIGRIEK